MPNETSTFSKNVRLLCRKQGLSLKELAEKANVRYDWLRRAVANGLQKQTKTNQEKVDRVAECLHVSVDKLFTRMRHVELNRGHDDELNEVLALYRAVASYKESYISRLIEILFDVYGIAQEDQTAELREQIRKDLNIGLWHAESTLRTLSKKERTQTCRDCNGSGVEKVCEECDGLGVDPMWNYLKEIGEECPDGPPPPCKDCHGKGKFDCPACKGLGIVVF